MYAVDPVQVRATAEKLTAGEIEGRLRDLGWAPWVTISGGNPALLELGQLVTDLHEREHLVAVETQASLWRRWLWTVDMLTCSPKPPSSEMVSGRHATATDRFLANAAELPPERRCLKIVVFDETDYLWARDVAEDRNDARGEEWPVFLSVGTDLPRPGPNTATAALVGISARYAWLCEKVALDAARWPDGVRVLPQLHVLAWGQRRGV